MWQAAWGSTACSYAPLTIGIQGPHSFTAGSFTSASITNDVAITLPSDTPQVFPTQSFPDLQGHASPTTLPSGKKRFFLDICCGHKGPLSSAVLALGGDVI
jgi:hypothetical protein